MYGDLNAAVSYWIGAEQEDEADYLLKNGLHLLVATFPDSRQSHQPSVTVLPVSCRQMEINKT